MKIVSGQETPVAGRASRGRRQSNWIERTLADITGAIERAVFTEEYTRKDGWLQRRDPRAKLGMFVLLALAIGLSNSLLALVLAYILLLVLARTSHIPFDFFVRRVWLGIPFFAGVVVLPSLFLASGPHLFAVQIGPLVIGPSLASILSAAVFVLRVAVSVSLAVLLIISTPWADLLKSLQLVRVPQVFVLLLSMTYRYIFLFLHTVNSLFEARKSRMVGYTGSREQRRWISSTMANLLHRSFKMSNDVYAAMMARGFSGTIRTYTSYHMTVSDWLALLFTTGIAVALWLVGRYV